MQMPEVRRASQTTKCNKEISQIHRNQPTNSGQVATTCHASALQTTRLSYLIISAKINCFNSSFVSTSLFLSKSKNSSGIASAVGSSSGSWYGSR